MSRDSPEEVNTAPCTEEELANSPDANGEVNSPVPELSGDSEEDPRDAQSGERARLKRLSAGTSEEEL